MNRKSKAMLYLLIFALPVNATWRDFYNNIPSLFYTTLTVAATCLFAGGTYYIYKHEKKKHLKRKFHTLLDDMAELRRSYRTIYNDTFNDIDRHVGQVCSILYGIPDTSNQGKKQVCAICKTASRSKVFFNAQEVKQMERETLIAATGCGRRTNVSEWCHTLYGYRCSRSDVISEHMFEINGMPNTLKMICHVFPDFSCGVLRNPIQGDRFREFNPDVKLILEKHIC